MVEPISLKFCMKVHIGPRQIFSPFWGSTPGIPKSEFFGLDFDHFTANRSKTLSRSVYMSIRGQYQLDEGFLNVSHMAVAPPGSAHPVWWVCVLLTYLLVYIFCFCINTGLYFWDIPFSLSYLINEPLLLLSTSYFELVTVSLWSITLRYQSKLIMFVLLNAVYIRDNIGMLYR